MYQRAAQAEFLPHAARQLLGRTIVERRETGAVQQFRNAPLALVARLPEQTAEKFDVLPDGEVRIEIFAKPLRHVGDPRTYRCAMPRVRDVAVEHGDAAGLILTRARNDTEKGGFPDPVRANQPDHAIRRYRDRHAIQRRDLAVCLREAVEDGNGSAPLLHGSPCRFLGQTTAESVRM